MSFFTSTSTQIKINLKKHRNKRKSTEGSIDSIE